MRQDPLNELVGIPLMVAVAGFLGGVVQLAFQKNLSLGGALVSMVAGVCSAIFGTPIISSYYSLPIPWQNGVAFLMGFLGLLIMGKIYEFFSGLTVDRILVLFKKGGPNGQI